MTIRPLGNDERRYNSTTTRGGGRMRRQPGAGPRFIATAMPLHPQWAAQRDAAASGSAPVPHPIACMLTCSFSLLCAYWSRVDGLTCCRLLHSSATHIASHSKPVAAAFSPSPRPPPLAAMGNFIVFGSSLRDEMRPYAECE